MCSLNTFSGLIRRHRAAVAVLAICVLAMPVAAAPPLRPLHDFDGSGPVRLLRDQVAAVCATNYGGETEHILLVIADATPGMNSAGILSSQRETLPPFQSACLYLSGANLQALGPQGSVVGLVVDNAIVDQGVIRQGGGIGGGGCIASLQILDAANGKAVLYAPMLAHRIR